MKCNSVFCSGILCRLLALLLACGCGASNDSLFLKQVEQVRQGVSESIDIRETPLSSGELLTELQGLELLEKRG